MSIHTRTRSILASLSGRQEETLHPEMNLVDDLGVDSLSKCEFVMLLESAFGVRINDDHAEQMQTVGDAFAVVERRLAHPGPA